MPVRIEVKHPRPAEIIDFRYWDAVFCEFTFFIKAIIIIIIDNPFVKNIAYHTQAGLGNIMCLTF